jgi:hypothetical protein
MAFQHDQGWIGMWKKDANGKWQLQAVVAAWNSGVPGNATPPSFGLELVVSRNDANGAPVFQPGRDLHEYTFVRTGDASDLTGQFERRNVWESMVKIANDFLDRDPNDPSTPVPWTGYRIDSGFDFLPTAGTPNPLLGFPTPPANPTEYTIIDATRGPAPKPAGTMKFYDGADWGASRELIETYKIEYPLELGAYDHRFPFDVSKLLIQPGPSAVVPSESALPTGTFLRAYSVVGTLTAASGDSLRWPTWSSPPQARTFQAVQGHHRPSTDRTYQDFMNYKNGAGDAKEWQLTQ